MKGTISSILKEEVKIKDPQGMETTQKQLSGMNPECSLSNVDILKR
jgi:hypothetical protein